MCSTCWTEPDRFRNMTNKSDDQMPSSGYYPASAQRRGCCSSDGGSGGSSCTESQEDRRRNDTEEEEESRHCQDVSESEHEEEEEEEEGMNTIKRNMRPVEPVRPPRVIDGHGRLEYYNLCHPPPCDPPAIPRRKPYISHLPHSQQSATTEPPTNTDTLSSLASRNNNVNKRKYQNRRKKGSVCNCKQSGINT